MENKSKRVLAQVPATKTPISVLLIYPFFKLKHDRSIFRFPPLGVAYIASALKAAGYRADILDCTFLTRKEALERARSAGADIIGIYSMITMFGDSLELARELKGYTGLLAAGGPLPTTDPGLFLKEFDVVVCGEGESTMVALARAFEKNISLITVPGVAMPGGPDKEARFSGKREPEQNLDALAFPARELLPNADYMVFGKKKYGYSITSLMSTRGCPFECDFCSSAVFGRSYRERSPKNVVDEVEQALAIGYEHIHFGDDVFTMKKSRLLAVCSEITRRGLKFSWECLGRVDSLDPEMALAMKAAGCEKMYFGIESGSGAVLKLMNKKISTQKAREAVEAAKAAGIRTGAFFILFYPGETDATVLETIRYALSLPLDYLAFSVPYPIPGTGLYERLKSRQIGQWKQTDGSVFGHKLTYKSEFSGFKMKFGILKGSASFMLKKIPGIFGKAALKLFEWPTDAALKLMK